MPGGPLMPGYPGLPVAPRTPLIPVETDSSVLMLKGSLKDQTDVTVRPAQHHGKSSFSTITGFWGPNRCFIPLESTAGVEH